MSQAQDQPTAPQLPASRYSTVDRHPQGMRGRLAQRLLSLGMLAGAFIFGVICTAIWLFFATAESRPALTIEQSVPEQLKSGLMQGTVPPAVGHLLTSIDSWPEALPEMLLLGVTALLVFLLWRNLRSVSHIVSAAQEAAAGKLDVPFHANGSVALRALENAFEALLASLRDKTQHIRSLAHFDRVTGLPNRDKIAAEAPALIASQSEGVLLFVDLDGFKAVNDSYGYQCGDFVLREVAERLAVTATAASAGASYVARIGGDSFALIVPGLVQEQAIEQFAQYLISTIRTPIALDGYVVIVGSNIGIARYSSRECAFDGLLFEAYTATNAARSSGRNTSSIFNARLAEESETRKALESDLIRAIEAGALTVYFQPKVSCADNKIHGVEALARWFHPTRGFVSPGIFIPMAEQAGLIRDLDRIILKKAIAEIGNLGATGDGIIVSVNVTASDIEDTTYAAEVVQIVRDTGFPPERLELELTESIAATNASFVREQMNVLRQFGIRLAMDDFGAGYSNLATMARLPLDTVKIDRSLAHGCAADPELQTILKAAIGLARDLGYETVVEGVEQPADLNFVAEAGATYVQGYIYSPPVSIDKLKALLDPKAMLPARPQPVSRASSTGTR